MLVVCFTFILLWLPQTLILITTVDAHDHSNKDETGASLAALSGLLNSALNFVLYCMTVKRFRAAACIGLRRLICCKTNDEVLSSRGTIRSTSSMKKKTGKKAKLNSTDTLSRKSTPSHYEKIIIYEKKNMPNGSDQATMFIVNAQDSITDRSSSSKLTPTPSIL